MEVNDVIRDVTAPIYVAKGWMKFLGVMMFGAGVLLLFTIVGVVIAWMPIWMGVLLFQSANRVEAAARDSNIEAVTESLNKIRKYIVVNSVFSLITLILIATLFFSGILFALAQIGDTI